MYSQRCDPVPPLGGVIALHPVLDRREHADHLFAPDLHGARVAVVRRAVDPGGLHQILAAEQQPGALRTANELAAAVADERGAALQVNVRNREDLRRRVDEAPARCAASRCAAIASVDIGPAVVPRTGEDVDHRGPRADRELQRLRRLDLDDLHADGANRRVVDVARVRRDDDFVPGEALEVGNADVQIGIAAGHARGRRVRHRRRAAGADHAPLGAGQLREPLADRRHQLVQLRVLLVRRALRRAHLRQLDRAADDRQRAAAVDQRADADRFVDVAAPAAARPGPAALPRRGRMRATRALRCRHRRALASRSRRRRLNMDRWDMGFQSASSFRLPACQPKTFRLSVERSVSCS